MLLKAVFPLSEEFQCCLSAEIYYEYSWEPYQLLDKKKLEVVFLNSTYKFYRSFSFLIMIKLCICVWTRISESTFPSNIPSHSSWKTVQLSKILCNNVPLITQQFERNVLLPEFLGVVSSLNLLKALYLFGEYLISVLWFLNHRVFDKFIQFKSCVKSASHYFHCFNGITNS